MNKIVGVLAVVGLAGAAVWLMGAKRPAKKPSSKGAAPAPTGSIPMGTPGRAMPTSTALPQNAVDYANRYTAWVAGLPVNLRPQAPQLVPAILLQGKTQTQVDAYLNQHAQTVQTWWDSVKATATTPVAATTPAQLQAANTFAELDRLTADQPATSAVAALPTQAQAAAQAQAQNAFYVRMAVDNYAAWVRTITTGGMIRRNWQAEAPKMPAVDLNSPGSVATVRMVYQTAAAWQSGQPRLAGVPVPPPLPAGFPA